MCRCKVLVEVPSRRCRGRKRAVLLPGRFLEVSDALPTFASGLPGSSEIVAFNWRYSAESSLLSSVVFTWPTASSLSFSGPSTDRSFAACSIVCLPMLSQLSLLPFYRCLRQSSSVATVLLRRTRSSWKRIERTHSCLPQDPPVAAPVPFRSRPGIALRKELQ